MSITPAIVALFAVRAAACDFCMAPLAGFGKGVREADGVAEAKVIDRRLLFADDQAARVATTFEITRVVRGATPAVGKTHRTTLQWRGANTATRTLVLFDRTDDGAIFLDALADPDGKLADYYDRAFAAGRKPAAERCAFFAGFLEHADAEIADDAYRQFVEIPFEGLREAKSSLNADRLRAWLKSDKVPVSRKGLYGLMLGVAGGPADAELFAAALAKTADGVAPSAGVLAGWCLAVAKFEEVLGPVVADSKRPLSCRRGALTAARFLWPHADEPGKAALRNVLKKAVADAELAPFAVDEFARLREEWMTQEVRRAWSDPARRTPSLRPAVLGFARGLSEPARSELYKLVDANP